MSFHPMDSESRTEERTSIRVVEYSNTTYQDPKYGELRTYAIAGSWEDTPENLALAQEYATEQRARYPELEMDWTVKVVLETITTVTTVVRKEIVAG